MISKQVTVWTHIMSGPTVNLEIIFLSVINMEILADAEYSLTIPRYKCRVRYCEWRGYESPKEREVEWGMMRESAGRNFNGVYLWGITKRV